MSCTKTWKNTSTVRISTKLLSLFVEYLMITLTTSNRWPGILFLSYVIRYKIVKKKIKIGMYKKYRQPYPKSRYIYGVPKYKVSGKKFCNLHAKIYYYKYSVIILDIKRVMKRLFNFSRIYWNWMKVPSLSKLSNQLSDQ